MQSAQVIALLEKVAAINAQGIENALEKVAAINAQGVENAVEKAAAVTAQAVENVGTQINAANHEEHVMTPDANREEHDLTRQANAQHAVDTQEVLRRQETIETMMKNMISRLADIDRQLTMEQHADRARVHSPGPRSSMTMEMAQTLVGDIARVKSQSPNKSPSSEKTLSPAQDQPPLLDELATRLNKASFEYSVALQVPSPAKQTDEQTAWVISPGKNSPPKKNSPDKNKPSKSRRVSGWLPGTRAEINIKPVPGTPGDTPSPDAEDTQKETTAPIHSPTRQERQTRRAEQEQLTEVPVRNPSPNRLTRQMTRKAVLQEVPQNKPLTKRQCEVKERLAAMEQVQVAKLRAKEARQRRHAEDMKKEKAREMEQKSQLNAEQHAKVKTARDEMERQENIAKEALSQKLSKDKARARARLAYVQTLKAAQEEGEQAEPEDQLLQRHKDGQQFVGVLRDNRQRKSGRMPSNKCWYVTYKHRDGNISWSFNGAQLFPEQTLLGGGSTLAARARRELIIALGDVYPPR